MRRLRATGFWMVVVLGLVGAVVPAAEPAPDAEIAKGIIEVNDGDYDAAILTLDRAVRRLASDPNRMRDLAQGYLYLGIAYAGKGHEAAARARFREAVTQMGDLSLSPDEFPPKIIDLFEAAKEEARRSASSPAVKPAAPAPAAGTEVSAAPTQAKKRGSRKWLYIGGAAAGLFAVSAANARKNKDNEPITQPWEGDLTPTNHYLTHRFGPAGGTGGWQAKFNWVPSPDEDPAVFVQFIVWDPNGTQLLVSRRSDARTTQAEFSGPAGSYEFAIETNVPPRFPIHFAGTVTFPAP